MRIGIDLGGTKTEIICLDKNDGRELYRRRVPTIKGDYTKTISTIKELIDLAEKELGTQGTIGIGIPGTISNETGLVKNANSTWLNGHPLDKDLEAATGHTIRIENDANCFAVSESTDGAGAGAPVVFGVIIGTGCGAGIVVDGKVLRGINSIGGEWGHNPLPYPVIFDDRNATALDQHFEKMPGAHDTLNHYMTNNMMESEYPGPLCDCGRRGCIERWVSGTGFKADYARVTGENLSTHDIIDAARNNEPKASAALNRYTDRLARALAGVINILDPDIVVLGGGMSNVESLYTSIPAIWGRYIFSDSVKTRILQARHGDSSGVRGAAWLWKKDERDSLLTQNSL